MTPQKVHTTSRQYLIYLNRSGIDENPEYDSEEELSEGIEDENPVIKRRRISRRTISKHTDRSDSSEGEEEPLNKHNVTTSNAAKLSKPRRKKYKPKNVIKLEGGHGKYYYPRMMKYSHM